jgi:small subunit ribosomal protein S21
LKNKANKKYDSNKDLKTMPVTVKGLNVEVRNDNINDALRKFKKKVQEDGKLQEVKEREEYLKPSVKRARAAAAARSRWLKKLAKDRESGI